MKKILIATKNEGKAREFRTFFEPKGFKVITLNELDNIPEIIENGSTFEENALIKAQSLTNLLQTVVVADDSGLMVDALGGEPGIFSARYAGDHDDDANNQKLLSNLEGIPEEKRTAVFHTSLVVTRTGKKPLVVDGEVKGRVLRSLRGEDGFGYDPLFYLPELDKTFAELTPAEKNEVSHRGRAIKKLSEKFDDWWVKE
ncbi:MAG: XTP/dITP diphosphatase [Liquorilactobacillus hordei]|uniref:dITP/XTP pyrophosphatase n=1 Tax=Liquorilactobacillus hordei DSM 19519 TaxID=1423759 RepID=A0A0R1MIQ2_9LACO|nr:XTP/dITP diphosphatase [Liquorilactobacillus hordei]KRL07872.1 HAM1 protein [Liquorilactobacillus hordei DSM 19519]MBZ2405342.1 XTP/dITP diphosphatase [Liquorilactobacillus hordei]QYH52123.1 XTP/dITP diphosphatase [Liquorilactobacillus hordei DSM 19519]